jgi:hypothetical protein
MTTAAKTNFGKELWMAAAGQTLVKVAELRSVSAPKISRATIDATTHDSPSGAQQFITEGVYDPGEITGSLNYVAGSTGDDTMIAAVTSGALYDFKIVVKAASGTEDMLRSGFMTSYGPDEAPTTGLQTASFAIKVSGAGSQAPTA